MIAAALSQAARGDQSPQQTTAAPNIVFILADDLGYRELGVYGQKKIRTPRLDRMAAEGMRFTQFYSGSPVCAPSRGDAADRQAHRPRAGARQLRARRLHGRGGARPAAAAAGHRNRGALAESAGLCHRRDRQVGARRAGVDGRADAAGLRFVLRLSRSEAGPQLLSDPPVEERDQLPAEEPVLLAAPEVRRRSEGSGRLREVLGDGLCHRRDDR